MKLWVISAGAIMLCLCVAQSYRAVAAGGVQPAAAATAQSEFALGHFNSAGRIAADRIVANPYDKDAAVLAGRVALLSNRLGDARLWFEIALELDPKDTTVDPLLAEVYRREDDFGKATPLLEAAGKSSAAVLARSLAAKAAYEIDGLSDLAILKFTQTDPLPVVQVRVNGGDPVNFLIDTGGSEVIVDTDYAKAVGIASLGTQTGTFAGGKQAPVELGIASSLALGQFTVRNLPVQILSTKSFSAIDGGRPIEGVIGTVLLYHFLATIDYPRGELILRRKTPEIDSAFSQEEQIEGGIKVPFWMAGDHYMVAWGAVDGGIPQLFLIDSGLAGLGFTAPISALAADGILTSRAQSTDVRGPGEGSFGVSWFKVNQLSLGAVTEPNVAGLAGVFPSKLQDRFGFPVDGLISHSFLRSYAVTFDFDRMLMVLTPRSQPVYNDMWPEWPPPPGYLGRRFFMHGGRGR